MKQYLHKKLLEVPLWPHKRSECVFMCFREHVRLPHFQEVLLFSERLWCTYVSVCVCERLYVRLYTQDVNSPCFQDKTSVDTRNLGGCYRHSLIIQRSPLGKIQKGKCSKSNCAWKTAYSMSSSIQYFPQWVIKDHFILNERYIQQHFWNVLYFVQSECFWYIFGGERSGWFIISYSPAF